MKIDKMGDWRRTHYSVDISPELDGQEVVVFGWVQEIRDLGGLRFLILQDKTGQLQITIHRHKVAAEVVRLPEEQKSSQTKCGYLVYHSSRCPST